MFLNYRTIAKERDFPAVVRLLAREFVDGATYFSIGTWLEQLSQIDLEILVEQAELLPAEEEGPVRLFVILSEMLGQAEGLESTEAIVQRRTGYLVMLLMCESLYRKGLIEFDRLSCSLGDYEMENNIVAWPKGSEKPPRPIKK